MEVEAYSKLQSLNKTQKKIKIGGKDLYINFFKSHIQN